MSLKELLTESTQRSFPIVRRIEDAEPVSASLEHQRSSDCLVFSYEEKYYTTLKLGVSWFADPAHTHYAKKLAEEAIFESVYGDIRGVLSRLRNAVYQRDREEAMRLIEKIDEATRL
jgi:hypothetical protein